MKRLIQNSILILLTVALAAGILWARDKARDEVCTAVTVEVINADSTAFVTPQGVLSDLKGQGIKIEGKRLADIDASDIEEALKLSPYLENADVVKCQDGQVLIRVSQLVPVLRVFDGDESYYVNRAGKRMAANAFYHSDVPIVQGHFTKKYPATRLLPLIDYVEHDSLLRSLVTMYQVRDTNNIIIVPEVSGHVVNMGNATGFENKFAKLKLFYTEVMPKRGWNTFDTISVKWNHQIVATRRVKAVRQELQAPPEDDEQAPDIETMTVGADNDAKKPDKDKKKSDKDKNTKKQDAKPAETSTDKPASADKKKSN